MKARRSGPHIVFDCPGCGAAGPHGGRKYVPVEGSCRWSWNGDLERPTLSPSILQRLPGAAAMDLPVNAVGEFVCHSFVRDGRIQFLSDSTHPLAGQTVDLPELPDKEIADE